MIPVPAAPFLTPSENQLRTLFLEHLRTADLDPDEVPAQLETGAGLLDLTLTDAVMTCPLPLTDAFSGSSPGTNSVPGFAWVVPADLRTVLGTHARVLAGALRSVNRPDPLLERALSILEPLVTAGVLDPFTFAGAGTLAGPYAGLRASLRDLARAHRLDLARSLVGPDLMTQVNEHLEPVPGPRVLIDTRVVEDVTIRVTRIHMGLANTPLARLLVLAGECSPGSPFSIVEPAHFEYLSNRGLVGDSAPLEPGDSARVLETALVLTGSLGERLGAARALEA